MVAGILIHMLHASSLMIIDIPLHLLCCPPQQSLNQPLMLLQLLPLHAFSTGDTMTSLGDTSIVMQIAMIELSIGRMQIELSTDRTQIELSTDRMQIELSTDRMQIVFILDTHMSLVFLMIAPSAEDTTEDASSSVCHTLVAAIFTLNLQITLDIMTDHMGGAF
jgi:hypothetical protein